MNDPCGYSLHVPICDPEVECGTLDEWEVLDVNT